MPEEVLHCGRLFSGCLDAPGWWLHDGFIMMKIVFDIMLLINMRIAA